ncbi:MAG: membrane bound O-acyl transferase MBOAT family protein, partial [uncultured bacterium]
LIANEIFSKTGIIPGIDAILGIYAFAFQIFGDFAGYSFIAMGISKFMGFHLMTNFLFPYFVTNPSDFWKNWHISLSSWLKDYLYIPLGGNKKGSFLTYRNLFLTMFLGGLWHGAGWTFIIWGVYQGVILIIFRLLYRASTVINKDNSIINFIKIFTMFQITCIGWLFFRAENIAQIKNMLYSIFFNLNIFSGLTFYYALIVIFHVWLVLAVQIIQKKNNNLLLYKILSYKNYTAIFLIMFYLIMLWGEFGGSEFIYFQF